MGFAAESNKKKLHGEDISQQSGKGESEDTTSGCPFPVALFAFTQPCFLLWIFRSIPCQTPHAIPSAYRRQRKNLYLPSRVI